MSKSPRRPLVAVAAAITLFGRATIAPLAVAHASTAASLVGAVHADGGTPVVGSPVGLFEQATGALSAETRTSASGEFRFEDVRPGRYRLAVGVTERAFTSATYLATVASPGSAETRLDWTLYTAEPPARAQRVAADDGSRSVAGVVTRPEPAAPLAESAFVTEVPAWVLATGAAGVAAGATLGGLCLSGTAVCEETKRAASPQE